MTDVEYSGLVLDLPDDKYHLSGGLSSTGARRLLPEFDGSPARFRYEQTHPRESQAFDYGRAAHAKVLGIGAPIVLYPDEHLTPSGNPSSKAATLVWESEQRAEGLTPVSQQDADAIDALAEAVLANPSARAFLELPGAREVSVFSEVDGVPTRCRFDALTDETPQGIFGIDLKTSRKAVSKERFSRDVLDLGYHVQQEFYRDTYRSATDTEITFVFIAVEKAAPHLVSVHQLNHAYQAMGRDRAREARRIYAECTATNLWPGWPEDVQLVVPPVWAEIQHEERYG